MKPYGNSLIQHDEYQCFVWGENIMLSIIVLMVLAIHGGLFAGTIAYSAWKAARMDQTITFAEKLWSLPLSF